MIRVTVTLIVLLVLLAGSAVGVHYIARHFWEKRVWQCYSSFPDPKQMPARLILSSSCRADAVLVSNLGQPTARVVLAFLPPHAMWLSYALNTSGYDSYSIEITPEPHGHRVAMHHGSD